MWTKVSDTTWPGEDSWVMEVGALGGWVWLQGEVYCAKHLTDGFIPDEALRIIAVSSTEDSVRSLSNSNLADR